MRTRMRMRAFRGSATGDLPPAKKVVVVKEVAHGGFAGLENVVAVKEGTCRCQIPSPPCITIVLRSRGAPPQILAKAAENPKG